MQFLTEVECGRAFAESLAVKQGWLTFGGRYRLNYPYGWAFELPTVGQMIVSLCKAYSETIGESGSILWLSEPWSTQSFEHSDIFVGLRHSDNGPAATSNAPGTIFDANERERFTSYLIVCSLFGWEYYSLSRDGRSCFIATTDENGYYGCVDESLSAGVHQLLCEHGARPEPISSYPDSSYIDRTTDI